MKSKLLFIVMTLSILSQITGTAVACLPPRPVAILEAFVLLNDSEEAHELWQDDYGNYYAVVYVSEANDTIRLDASSSIGGALSYEWDVGNGYSSGAVYKDDWHPTERVYTIKLRVTKTSPPYASDEDEICVIVQSRRVHKVPQDQDPDKDIWYHQIQHAIKEADDDDNIIANEGTYLENINFLDKNITVQSTAYDNPDTVKNTIIEAGGMGPVVSFEGPQSSGCKLKGFTIRGRGSGESNGLLAYWKLDGDATDSASSNDGAIDGATTTTGQLNDALNFDGTDDYVLGSTSPFDFADTTFTVAAWFKKLDTEHGMIVSEGGRNSGWFLSSSYTGQIIVLLKKSNSYDAYRATTTDAYTNGQWHHVAAVITTDTSGTSGNNADIYVDGNLVSVTHNKIDPYGPSTTYWTIGTREAGFDYFFKGIIDEVRIYNIALPQEEIEQLCRAHGGGINGKGTEAEIHNCVIQDNYSGYDGGGIFDVDGDIINCVITGNTAAQRGGGLADCNGDIVNCTIVDNTAGTYGGGLYNEDSNANVENCTFVGNMAGFGGGMFNNTCDPEVKSCAFIGNGAYYYNGEFVCGSGGGIYNLTSNPSITNCTFVDNVSVAGGAIFNHYNSSAAVKNCILWGNFAVYGSEVALSDLSNPSTLTISYSDVDVKDGSSWAYADANCTLYWGTGNITCDPLFADAANDVFHLKSEDGRWDPSANEGSGGWDYDDTVTSRCVVAGDPSSEYSNEPTPNGGRVNIGAYGNTPYASKMNTNSLGSLTINIGPPGAVSGGAKWSVGYDGLWHDSGYEKEGLVPGSYDVFFNEVTNYVRPADQEVDVAEGEANSYGFDYTTTLGGLTVIIGKPDAGNWKAVNDADPSINTGWRKSGYVALPAGTYTISFSSVSEWGEPDDITDVSITAGQTVGPYERDYTYMVRYVAGNGHDWWDGTATHPYRMIQKGVDEVPEGGTVYVEGGSGTFYHVVFPDKALTLTGQSNPVVTGSTIYTVFTFINISESITVEYFTIENGKSTAGGGMYIYNSSPTVRYCTFQDNEAYNSSGYAFGGGLYIAGGGPTIRNCDFSNNEAYGRYLLVEDLGYGGAIYTLDTGASFYDCTIGTIQQNLARNNNQSDEICTDAGAVPCYDNCAIRGGLTGNYSYHPYTVPGTDCP